jgi:hypothetical protein
MIAVVHQSVYAGSMFSASGECGQGSNEMVRIIIQGLASVYSNDEPVTDSATLQSLDGLVYDDERFTDYLNDTGDEGVVAGQLVPGGNIRFSYQEGSKYLGAVTEFQSRRRLSDSELALLVNDTMGQWSDGVGENWACISAEKCGYTIICLAPGDGVRPDYPTVEVTDE